MTIIPFPIEEDAQLTLTQAYSAASNRNPKCGVIIFYDEDDNEIIFNFGKINRQEALWLHEMGKRHAVGDDI